MISVCVCVCSSQNVGILINGSVPDLQGLRVECDFGVGIATNATVHLDYGTTQIQTCPLPPPHMYPTIPFGRGAYTNTAAVNICSKSLSDSLVNTSFLLFIVLI